jgi:integrase
VVVAGGPRSRGGAPTAREGVLTTAPVERLTGHDISTTLGEFRRPYGPLAKGKTAEQIHRILGHSRPSVTETIYLHHFDQQKLYAELREAMS